MKNDRFEKQRPRSWRHTGKRAPIRSHRFLPAVLLFLLAVHGAALAAPATLSLADAVRAAELRSQALPAREAVAASAREMAVAARQLPDPVLNLAINNFPVEGAGRWSLNSDFMTMSSVGLMQTLTREDKRQARGRRYEQEARTAQARTLMALAELRRDTALAWLERHYREAALMLLRRQRNETALLVEAVEAGYRAGLNPQSEVFLARTELALSDDRIREAEALVGSASTVLARWTGSDPAVPLADPPPLDSTRLESAGLESELLRHPEHLQLAGQEAIALAEVELAQENKREDWSVELMFSRRGPDFGNMVSVGFSRPLQLGQANKQDRELAAKLALVDSVRAEHTELLREHVAMARSWLELWRGNLERLAAYDDTLVPLAAERSEATLAAYRGNDASLDAVLESRRAELDTSLARVRLELETAALWARLEYLIPPESTTFNAQFAGGNQ